ncbi:eukaryotic initiation factor [Dunaliella salina]|uniref:Eukaryotic initiation factor n=1 Tax=Dunaliella salina TaxID=3046 RepID=A0ABQ7GVZ0_DUNSA|nr:eukaryotic initiation factor [Dunaliella salina]|eukprot:KAF5838715.1 eukaryotic initiation factor [Dunaliella salina]
MLGMSSIGMLEIEGRGNGIKTNIVNNVDIAKSLERPPEYVLKYFGYELGAQTNYDKATGTCIVNGAHDSKKLSEFLEGFIKKYVQCYSCGNPETQIKIKKEDLLLKCRACGFVSEVDPRSRLNSFVVKNPPEVKISKEEKKLKKAEAERVMDAEKAAKREKKEAKKKKEEEGRDPNEKDDDESASDEGDEDGVVWMTDTSAEAAKQRAQEQLTSATAAMVTQGNIEAEQEAQRKREKKKAEEEARAKAEAEAQQQAEEAERQALAQQATPVGSVQHLLKQGADAEAISTQLKTINPPGGIPGKMRVLLEAVFGLGAPEAKLADTLTAHRAQVAAHAKDAPSQLALLIALEHYMSVSAPERVKETPIVLKAMYDADLADEDVIMAWAGKKDAAGILGLDANATKDVRRLAAPFVSWLQEADETESDDDE